MPPMYILATQISPMRTTCALKVRCVRTYEVREWKSSEAVKCRECVFHDSEGNVLHAYIPREHVVKFQNQFVEGKYKNLNFPRHMFRLRSFKSLRASDQIDDKELIDVIGRIVEIYSPIERIVGGKPSRLIDFLIEDESGDEMKCTVWDDHVDKVDSCSYDATQLFINEDIPEILELRDRICGEKTPMRSICSISSMSAANTFDTFNSGSMIMTTIAEVYEKKQYDDYWVVAKIVGIENGLDWYYNSCKTSGCSKKLTLNANGCYDCYKCNKTWGEGMLRYRLKVRVVDRNGNASFLLWDRECKELIGMSAVELRDKYPQVINDTKLIDSYCPELLESFDNDPTSKLQSNDCFESDEEFISEGEVESPLAITGNAKDVEDLDSGSVKRCLLDEYSSSKTSTKKMLLQVKLEKTSEDVNMKNLKEGQEGINKSSLNNKISA
ncbi:replication protein A 70 kDa DNA-binding subunit A-like [Ipomoea triloba]|uniref:replication protein A 70 kDa DNA-binding subunit A-like n=1 Tax=Ipomoea triloba TaxID=35885 RepID=UPI00125CD5E5|nr:replication protein A 70 kDa DNA-binding subunit A-like [Ipomoea triloba]